MMDIQYQARCLEDYRISGRLPDNWKITGFSGKLPDILKITGFMKELLDILKRTGFLKDNRISGRLLPNNSVENKLLFTF